MSKRKSNKKGLKITALVLACVIVVWGIIALLPRGDNFKLDNPM